MNENNIYSLVKKRKSILAFSDRKIENEKLKFIFGHARLTPSSMNEQPWNVIIGVKEKGKTYEVLLDSLAEGNKIWAKSAPILIAFIAKIKFDSNGKENKWAFYDLGQFAAFFTFLALSEGLHVHQMGGFNPETLKKSFNLSDNFIPVTIAALGYKGIPDLLSENLKNRELSPSSRKNLDEFIFSEGLNSPFIFNND